MARRQLEHGDCLSQRTLRCLQVRHDRGLGGATGVASPLPVVGEGPEEAAAVRKSRSAPQRSKAAGRPRGSERRLSFYKWVFAL